MASFLAHSPVCQSSRQIPASQGFLPPETMESHGKGLRSLNTRSSGEAAVWVCLESLTECGDRGKATGPTFLLSSSVWKTEEVCLLCLGTSVVLYNYRGLTPTVCLCFCFCFLFLILGMEGLHSKFRLVSEAPSNKHEKKNDNTKPQKSSCLELNSLHNIQLPGTVL